MHPYDQNSRIVPPADAQDDNEIYIPGQEDEPTPVNMGGGDVPAPEILKEDTVPTKDEANDDILQSVLGETKSSPDKDTQGTNSICIPCSNKETNAESILEEVERIGLSAWRTAREDGDSKCSTMFDSTLFFTKQMEFNMEALTAIKSQNENIKHLRELFDKSPIFKEGMTKRVGAPKDKVLSGFRARARIIAQMQGMCRIPLINSGFYITVKALSIAEIASFVRTCQHNKYYFTREMGGYFYLYADIFIKELILRNFLVKIIQDSSLSGWAQMGEDILKYISIHDYDTILGVMASLMFRDGIPVRYYCAEYLDGVMNGDQKVRCEHVEEVKADILKLRVCNVDLITEEMMNFLNFNGKVDPEQVLIYQKNIAKNIKPYRFTIDNKATGVVSHWEIKYRIPTADHYLTYGNEYCNLMFNQLRSDAENADESDIFHYLQYNYYKLLLPWLESISEIEDINGSGEDNIISTVKNDPYDSTSREDISEILDVISTENVALDVSVSEYVKATKITHMVHQYDKCPKCGKAPKNAVDGFIPFDVQSNFFTMCLIRLTAANR